LPGAVHVDLSQGRGMGLLRSGKAIITADLGSPLADKERGKGPRHTRRAQRRKRQARRLQRATAHARLARQIAPMQGDVRQVQMTVKPVWGKVHGLGSYRMVNMVLPSLVMAWIVAWRVSLVKIMVELSPISTFFASAQPWSFICFS